MVICVDFDDFLFTNKYPNVGKPIKKNIDYVLKLQEAGARLILWTCRDGKPLKLAVKACEQQGIKFVAVNDDDPILKANWKEGQSRKVFADYYLDDKNLYKRKQVLKLLTKAN